MRTVVIPFPTLVISFCGWSLNVNNCNSCRIQHRKCLSFNYSCGCKGMRRKFINYRSVTMIIATIIINIHDIYTAIEISNIIGTSSSSITHKNLIRTAATKCTHSHQHCEINTGTANYVRKSKWTEVEATQGTPRNTRRTRTIGITHYR